MLRKFCCLTLLFWLTACTTMTGQYSDLPYSDRIEKGQLDNGFKFFLAPNAKPEQRVYIRLVVNAGSLNEDDDQLGVAHIVEHMAFNGTENYPGNSIITALEQAGMKFGVDINAFTDFENTVYQLNLPNNNKETIALALDVVADWAGRVTFLGPDLDAERGVVLEEWRSRLGPQLRLGDKKSAYEMADSHYLARDPIGTVDIINNVSVERVADFYHRWYRPDNMAVVVGGDVDASEIKQLLREKLDFLPTPKTPLESTDYSVPIKDGWRVASITEQSRADSALELSFFNPYHDDNSVTQFQQDVATKVAIKLLNIRFQKWEESQADFIDTATYFSTNVGRETAQNLFAIQLANPEFERATVALFNMLAQIKQQGFLEPELAGEKSRLALQLDRSKENISTVYTIDLISDMVDSAATGQVILGKADQIALFSAALDKLTLAQVNDALLQLISSESRLLLQVHPSGVVKDELNAEKVPELWLQAMMREQPIYQLDKVSAQLPEAPAEAGDLYLEQEWPDLGIKEYRLSNGSKLIYKYSDHDKDEVNFKASTSGGLMSIPSADFHRLKIAAELVDDTGIGSLSREQLRSLMDGRLIAFSTIVDDYQQGYTGWSKSRDLTTLFKLFRLQHDEVQISAGAMAKYKRDMLRRFAETSHDAEDIFARQVSAIRYPEQPTVYNLDPKVMNTLTREQLIDTYRQYMLSKTDYTYYIVGDIQEAHLLPMVKRYLASLPAQTEKRLLRKPQLGSQEKRLTVAKNKEPSAEVEIYYHFPKQWNLAQSYQLDAAGELVQQQLRVVLREQASGVYGVASWFWQEAEDENITGRIGFTCSPERVDELVALTDQVLVQVKDKGISASRLNDIKKHHKDNYQRMVKSNLGWLDVISRSYELYGVPTMIYAQEKLIDELKKADIDAVLSEVLTKGSRFEAVLIPES